MHTTNYTNTFIAVAEDCPVNKAEIPALKGDSKTVANLQFEMVYDHPYKYTSDDILFTVHAIRNKIAAKDLKAEREKFFSKGQPCLRASPLTKRYGWGAHSDAAGKVAIYDMDSKEYKKFLADKKLEHTKAMRSKRG